MQVKSDNYLCEDNKKRDGDELNSRFRWLYVMNKIDTGHFLGYPLIHFMLLPTVSFG